VLVKEKHTRLDWADVVAYMAEEMYPSAEKITLIQDNLSAHKKSALYEIFTPERARSILERIEFVNTPKHGSWLNVAECGQCSDSSGSERTNSQQRGINSQSH
jgi:hypothetical protein